MKNINHKILTAILSLLLFVGCKSQPADPLVNYIDIKIGTSNDGSNCVIGPQLPFGSINPSPQTPNGQNDGYDPGQPIRGFGQLQVSGTGWGKYGQVFVSPQTGLAVGETDHDSPKSNEVAKPYEYDVTLDRYQVRTEFTPSYHSAIYRFIFPVSDSSNILIDLSHNIPADIYPAIGGTISEGTINIDSANAKISGFGNYSGGFGGGNYKVYFQAEFNRMPDSTGTWKNGLVSWHNSASSISQKNDSVGAFLNYHTVANDTIYMKIAVSFKSVERAGDWLLKEIPEWDYDSVKNNAIAAWESQLEKIKVESASVENKTIFYTAMYHAMLMPRNRTNDMVGFDDSVPVWDDHYAVWDTWRTLYPLMTLINPDMVGSTVNSFIERLKTNKVVRDAYIAGNDMAEEQGGNNIDNIIADAYVKGVAGVDWEEAYKVLKNDADKERAGWQGWGSFSITDPVQGSYKTKGWIPAGTMSCSKSLEYSYNDFCASEVASGLGYTDDAVRYLDRSGLWINLWNKNAESDGYQGFIEPRKADRSWVEIDPKKNWGSWSDYFYEGSSWTYSLFIPHQFPRLVWLNGGKEKYVEKLDYGFKNKLIDFANEPAFVSVYSFIYAGRPDLASYWSKQLLVNGYSLKGYPGNDDSGAMSSWYIFNAVGFFPNAGQDIYYLTGSIFDKITLDLGGGKKLTIEAENASKDNVYVQSCTLNGEVWDHAWLLHKDIKDGADLKFVMGPQPSDWAINDTSFEYQGCSSDSLLTALSGNKVHGDMELKNFPNPFKENTYISAFIPENTQLAELMVFDNTGRKIQEIEIPQRGDSLIELNSENYKSGIYYLSINYDGKKSSTLKINKL